MFLVISRKGLGVAFLHVVVMAVNLYRDAKEILARKGGGNASRSMLFFLHLNLTDHDSIIMKRPAH